MSKQLNLYNCMPKPKRRCTTTTTTSTGETEVSRSMEAIYAIGQQLDAIDHPH